MQGWPIASGWIWGGRFIGISLLREWVVNQRKQHGLGTLCFCARRLAVVDARRVGPRPPGDHRREDDLFCFTFVFPLCFLFFFCFFFCFSFVFPLFFFCFPLFSLVCWPSVVTSGAQAADFAQICSMSCQFCSTTARIGCSANCGTISTRKGTSSCHDPVSYSVGDCTSGTMNARR
mgnify:CR=1 FL=1